MDMTVTILAITAALSLFCCVFSLICMTKLSSAERRSREENELLRREAESQQRALRQEISRSVNESVGAFARTLSDSQRQSGELQDKRIGELTQQLSQKNDMLQKTVNDQLFRMENGIGRFTEQSAKQLNEMRETIEKQLDSMRNDNSAQLEKMRVTVDEKLQKTLDERLAKSFEQVSARLEQVYKGLGEMQTLANGVGDLKKVLSNVKTRGILGEIQLGAILEQILSPEQYETNVKTRAGSSAVVEFAVKLPGDGESTVWLPIDAKFPGDTYAALMDAYDSGSPEQIAQAAKELETRIKGCAKDIRDKYIDPPNTTDFAIMFLPFEGLYAEVVRRGMVETLTRDYRVNIAGPTTMAALLNSLQMGFRTLAIQKRSGEVWKVLGEVKTEFGKFNEVLLKAQERIKLADRELEKLITTRSNVMERKLRNVEALPLTEETQSAELNGEL